MMRRQRYLPAAAAAVLMLALTACGGNTPGEDGKATETALPIPTETTAPAPESTTSPAPSESTGTAEPSSPQDDNTQVLKGTGTYVGQIDNHSVEIVTADGPTAFELGAVTESALDQLNTDDKVMFEYVEKAVEGDAAVKQRVLTKLTPAN